MNNVIVELMDQIEYIYKMVMESVNQDVIAVEPPTSFSFDIWFKNTSYGLNIALPFNDNFCETNLLKGTISDHQLVYDGAFGYNEVKTLVNKYELIQEIKFIQTSLSIVQIKEA